MIFAHDIPELSSGHVFPGQIVNAMMGPQCADFAGQAMLSSFVRFVEAAGWQYRAGREAAISFLEQQNLYGFLNASSCFETCIGYMHRAILCMRAILAEPATATVRDDLFRQVPPFMDLGMTKPISDFRDAIQHSDDRIFGRRRDKPKIERGTPFMLSMAGTELPTPEPNNPAQTTKTWDRVEIGPDRLTFAEIARCLDEMAASASSIVEYPPLSASPSDGSQPPTV